MELLKKVFRYFSRIVLVGLVVGLILLGYAYFIEPDRLIIKEVSLNVPNWSRELNGFKIAAISDIHGGSHNITEEKISTIAEQINAQNPDIVVMLGDFVTQIESKHSGLVMPIERIVQNLKGLKAKYGVFVVIGNHDWWYDEKKCRAEFEKVGFTVLENETKSFEVNNKTVTILGIEDFWKRRKVDVKDVLEKLPTQENIIGITHNPDSFDQTPESLAILLAGHTHGGQVNFPLIGAPIVPSNKEYTAGHVEKNGKNLYVTTGIGTSGLPVRFRVPPEIAVITLNSNQ